MTDGKFPGGQAIEELKASKGSGYYLMSDGAYYVDGFSSAGRVNFANFESMDSFLVYARISQAFARRAFRGGAMNALSLNGVNKHYGQKHALIDFDYDFHDGVYGLLGPNGAGKSTMMNLITQNIPADPDSEILWNGEDIKKLQAKYRRKIGFMPQQQELYPSFTASRFSAISPRSRA